MTLPVHACSVLSQIPIHVFLITEGYMLSILNIQNLRAGASACNACGAGYYSGSTGMCYKYIFLQLVCST